MDLQFPVLAISEGERFTGIWACADETQCRLGARDAFNAGCWENLDLVDNSGRVDSVTNARIEKRLPASWSQRLIPASRVVQVSFELGPGTNIDLASLKQRILRIVGDDEEGFAEMRALYHNDDFESWRSQIAQAETFEAVIALFRDGDRKS